MAEYSSSRFEGLDASVKRKRSLTLRRPRDKTRWGPGSDDGDGDGKQKMFNLSQCISRDSQVGRANSSTRTKNEGGRSSVVHSNGNGGAGPSAADGAGNEKKLKKVKLKVGGVTHTIQTKSSSSGVSAGGSSTKASRSSDTSRVRVRSLQGSFGRDNSPPDKRGSLSSSRGGNHGKEDLGKMPAKGSIEKLADKSDLVRKSKRVPKKRVLDEAFDDEDDDEIRYLEKLKSSKVAVYYEEEPNKKRHSVSRLGKQENLEGKDGQKSRSDRGSEDTEYGDEEELLSEGEPETKKQKKDSSDSPPEGKRGLNLTSRQRALLSGKDASSGGSPTDFFDGLPPPAPRKQKEKLTEVEQQLKRAEAAERRRLQNQKANEESQAEAIRKILGQDASRKKKEEQKKKRLELAQAASQILGANTIRWVMGPTGTVVTFPQDMGLPQIFESKASKYPPPREKCAGPACMNPYKYRDSKSQLPLCSLQCYKAIREMEQAETV